MRGELNGITTVVGSKSFSFGSHYSMGDGLERHCLLQGRKAPAEVVVLLDVHTEHPGNTADIISIVLPEEGKGRKASGKKEEEKVITKILFQCQSQLALPMMDLSQERRQFSIDTARLHNQPQPLIHLRSMVS